jgi:hypothetical protein
MSADTLLTAVVVLDSLLARASSLNASIMAARKEGRDITDAELEAAASKDDIARAALAADIAKAKAEGR